MTFDIIGPEAEAHLTWDGLVAALEAGHSRPRAQIADIFLYRGADTLLSRAAVIDGLGQLVKTATVFPGNVAQGEPAVNGAVTLFDDATGALSALVDFHLVTKWKTAGDSLLSARKLARADSRRILIVGAGTVARSMAEAYRSAWPEAEITFWNRTAAGAEAAATATGGHAVTDLEGAVRQADIIATATMSREPLIEGDWLQPGTHLDLIGAYRPDMREVDDTALQRARLFVDARATTVAHIGELKDPIARGVISDGDIIADFYDLAKGIYDRRTDDEITIAKNGGGAHLDLMTAAWIRDMWRNR
jgi:ornithine cyclodeaminase